jgi:GT2 family glycosyltransferase
VAGIGAVTARQPRIGVVVLYYRFGGGVSETISRVGAQTPRPHAIVLVDNASGDGVCAAIAAQHDGVILVEAGQNRGYGAGMNLGLQALPSVEFVLLLTHDCLLEHGSLQALLAHHEKHPTAGVAGPLLAFRDRRDTVFSAGGWIAPRGSATYHHGHLDEVGMWNARAARPVQWLDGSCQLIRSVTLADVGPYDEDYFLYWEEVAYHARVRERGWSVWCVPRAMAYQSPGDYRTYYAVRNQLRYLARHGGRRALGRSFLATLRRTMRDPEMRPVGVRALRDFLTGYGGPEPQTLRDTLR